MDEEKNSRLKEARERLGLSRTEMAQKIGMKFSSYCAIERGTRTLTPKHIILICDKTDINREWIENGTGEMLSGDRYQALYDMILKLNPEDRDMVIGMVKRFIKEDSQE